MLIASLGISALVVAGVNPVRGASIASYLKNRHAPPDIQAGEVNSLKQYFAGGPLHWASNQAPKLPQGLVLTDSTGNLLNKPVVNFLIWKRDLAPKKFDARHPKIAPLFQQYDNQRGQILASIYAQYKQAPKAFGTSAALKSRTSSLQVLTNPPKVAAQGLTTTAQPVPEPASVASTLCLFAAGGLWYRRTRTRA